MDLFNWNEKNDNRCSNEFFYIVVEFYFSDQSVKDLNSEKGVSEVSIYN